MIAEPLSPIATIPTVKGVPVDVPVDLYIPPDALEVFLETFEGPLDLLLYLIRKNNLDILDIPIAEITRQYMEYVELMKEIRLELAADYLVMAAMLAEIKSRMLLPRQPDVPEEEADPRLALMRRLQEYERFKKAAEDIALLPQVGREILTNAIFFSSSSAAVPIEKPHIELSALLDAFLDVLKRSELMATHTVRRELLSVRERMSQILAKLNDHENRLMVFQDCFCLTEGRLGVVVSFLAILELLKLGLADIVQVAPFGPIHIKSVGNGENDA